MILFFKIENHSNFLKQCGSTHFIKGKKNTKQLL